MNNFFGDQQTEDRITQSAEDQELQEVEETESDLTDDGAVEIASEEQEDDEEGQEAERENDFQEQLKQKDAEIEKIRMDANNWVRALQSSHDKQLAELQRQVQTLIDAQTQGEESSFDEDDYMTGSQMKQFMEREKKKELSNKEKEEAELKRQEQEKLQEAQAWLYEQPDIKQVWDFYEKNLKSDPTINRLNYQAQYYYVKNKMIEQESKPAIKKKPKKYKLKKENYPPVGNPNRNFSASSGSVPSAQGIMQALEKKRKEWGNSRSFFN